MQGKLPTAYLDYELYTLPPEKSDVGSIVV